MNHRKALRAAFTAMYSAGVAACAVYINRYPEACAIGAAALAAVGYVYRIHPPADHH